MASNSVADGRARLYVYMHTFSASSTPSGAVSAGALFINTGIGFGSAFHVTLSGGQLALGSAAVLGSLVTIVGGSLLINSAVHVHGHQSICITCRMNTTKTYVCRVLQSHAAHTYTCGATWRENPAVHLFCPSDWRTSKRVLSLFFIGRIDATRLLIHRENALTVCQWSRDH